MVAGMFLSLWLVADTFAADANKPHEHQGIVPAYKGAPPALSLSASELATLQSGSMVLKQVAIPGAAGGRGVAIMDIRASVATIWSKVTAYARYPEWVENVTACGNYRVSGNEMYTRFLLNVMHMDVEYFIHHSYHPEANYLTWTLDYSRNSDLDDSIGYWRVTPLTTEPALSRLEYSVDIRFKGWIPGFVQDMIAKKGLSSATSWVKKQSER